jgi:hypothetical protein
LNKFQLSITVMFFCNPTRPTADTCKDNHSSKKCPSKLVFFWNWCLIFRGKRTFLFWTSYKSEKISPRPRPRTQEGQNARHTGLALSLTPRTTTTDSLYSSRQKRKKASLTLSLPLPHRRRLDWTNGPLPPYHWPGRPPPPSSSFSRMENGQRSWKARWPSGRRQQRWWGGPRLHRIRGRVQHRWWLCVGLLSSTDAASPPPMSSLVPPCRQWAPSPIWCLQRGLPHLHPAGRARYQRTLLSGLLPSEFITHGLLYDVMLPSLGSRSASPTSAGSSLSLCLCVTLVH